MEELLTPKISAKSPRQKNYNYLEYCDEGLFFINHELIVDINPVVTRQLGYSAEKLIGTRFIEILDLNSHSHITTYFDQNNATPLQTALLNADKVAVPVILRCKKVNHQENEFDLVLSCTLDYSNDSTHNSLIENPASTTELSSSSSLQLQRILDDMADTIYRTDENGLLVFASKSAKKLLGYSAEELIGTALADFYCDPDGRQKFLQALSLNGGEVKDYEAALRHKNGDAVWVSTNAHFLYGDDGRPIGVEGAARDITARRRAEYQRDRFFNLSADMLCILDFNGCFVDLNAAWQLVFGFEDQDIIAKSLIEFIHQDNKQITLDNLEKLRNSEEAVKFVNQYQTKQGTYKWLQWNAVSIKEQKLIFAVAHDITELKNNEAVLHHSKEQLEITVKQRTDELSLKNLQYKILSENIADSILVYDDLGNIVDCNQHTLDNMGYSEADIKNLSIFDIDCDASKEKLIPYLQSKQSDAAILFEANHKRKDGSIFPTETKRTAYYQDAKKYFISVVRDVTERKLNEFALYESENRFRTLSTHAPVGIFLTNAIGECLFVNEKFESLTGLSQEQALGNGWHRVLHPDDKQIVFHEWERFIREKDEFSLEYRFLKHGKDVIWVSGKAISLLDGDNKITGYLGTISDISEQKNAQILILSAKEEAEFANRAKSEFLARMSHELRTPLNAILGFGQLLQISTGNLTVEQKEGIKHIIEGGQHLLHLINDVLDISKVDAGEMSLNIDIIPVRDAVQSALLLVRPLASKHKVNIMPLSPLCNLYMKADLHRLKQVLVNLLSNAIKYNRKDGQVTITCNLKRQAGSSMNLARIEVKDSGIGIERKDFNKVFEPFQRVNLRAETIEGTGVGLNITKKMINLMHGNIGFESTYGIGSTFWFELPSPVSELLIEKDIASYPLLPPKSSINQRILYIEDNPANLKLMQHIITQTTNSQLLSARTAESGIHIARAQKPNIILMDIDLPEMEGFEAIDILSNDPETRNIPVIAISGLVSDSICSEKISKFAAYLNKPVNVELLLTTIENAISN